MNRSTPDFDRERRESNEPVPLDQKFRETILDPESFRARLKSHEQILKLSEVRHQMDGRTILEHTRSVLINLRTDTLRDIKLDETTFQTPELMRVVALYHDIDKGLREKPDVPIQKSEATEVAVRELKRVKPDFLQTDADEKVFRTLIENCDYFGYNLSLLSRQGTAFRDGMRSLLKKHLEGPLDALAEEGIDLDYEDFLRIQYEISRADTLGIEPFKQNVGQIDRLFEELNKAFAY